MSMANALRRCLRLERKRQLRSEPLASARADFRSSTPVRKNSFRQATAGLAIGVCAITISGCSDFFANQSASFGSSTAGRRGSIRVLFINNTPFRAVTTYGTFDQTDQGAQPAFEQFAPNDFQRTLEADESSDIRTLACGRVFGVGSANLLALIDSNVSDDALVPGNLPGGSIVGESLVQGVEFFSVDADADSGDELLALEGTASPFEALLGAEFACNSLLILRLEFDDVDPDFRFRVDFEVIPSASDR